MSFQMPQGQLPMAPGPVGVPQPPQMMQQPGPLQGQVPSPQQALAQNQPSSLGFDAPKAPVAPIDRTPATQMARNMPPIQSLQPQAQPKAGLEAATGQLTQRLRVADLLRGL